MNVYIVTYSYGKHGSQKFEGVQAESESGAEEIIKARNPRIYIWAIDKRK
jgi:hypothetical protein